MQVPRREVAGVEQGHVEEREVHVPAQSGGAGRSEAGEKRVGEPESGHEVHHREAEAGRRGFRLASEGEVAGFRLHEVVESGPVGTRSLAPVRREVRTHDSGIDGLQCVVSETEAGGDVAAQVGGERVGARRQLIQQGAALLTREIEGEALLVAVQGVEEEAVVLLEEEGSDPPRHVAAVARIFDLDHFGALIREKEGAERARAVLLDAQDPDAIKGEHGLLSGRPRRSYQASCPVRRGREFTLASRRVRWMDAPRGRGRVEAAMG